MLFEQRNLEFAMRDAKKVLEEQENNLLNTRKSHLGELPRNKKHISILYRASGRSCKANAGNLTASMRTVFLRSYRVGRCRAAISPVRESALEMEQNNSKQGLGTHRRYTDEFPEVKELFATESVTKA